MKKFRLNILVGLIALLGMISTANASHFRGAAMVPEIDANGLLTITGTSFWRKGQASFGLGAVSVTSLGSFSGISSIDTSDSRYDVNTQVYTRQLTTMGTYYITTTSCCRVAVGGLGNWSENSWRMNSTIVWDGSNATKPIDFNFASVQSQVSRLGAYSDNLGAVSPDGLALTYNQALNLYINTQIPGFTVNTATGALDILAADTPSITDNLTLGGVNGQNKGADAAFSGNIIASNGSSVEFDWMFDGVDTAVNQAPNILDGSATGSPGDIFNFTFTATDPDGDPLSWDTNLFSFLGAAPAITPTWNSSTQLFSWDSTGSILGNYIAQVRVADPRGLTDIGSFNIALLAGQPPVAGVIPEPTTIALLGIGLVGLAGAEARRRRKQKATDKS